ncbi:MAG: cytochrome c maturation protein CcmE [Proteobacteria bacterium]|nr:cytochrome c maturation protein CcmE [Pseudomonadota bacterium]
MSPKVFIAVSLAAATIALTWIAIGSIGSNLVYYWTPTELQAAEDAGNATVRLGGMVKTGTIDWNKDTGVLNFVVHDGTSEVPVRATEMPPQMFRENIGVVVEGKLDADGVFISNRLLVKHDNEYRAPHDPKEVDVQKLWESLDAGEQ